MEQTLTGSVVDGDGQEVTIQLGALTETVTPDGDGSWSLALSPAQLGSLAAGDTDYVVSTSDAAGNTTISEAVTFTVDFAPPPPEDVVIADIAVLVAGEPIGAVLNRAQGEEEAVTVTGTVTGNEGRPVTVSINGVERTATQDGDSFTATFEAGALSGLEDGAKSFTVATTDADGAPVTASSGSFTIAFTPPALSIDNIGDEGAVDPSVPLTVTGTALGAEGQQVTVTYDGVDYTDTVAGDGSWSVEIPADALAGLTLGDGLTITANVTDANGNPADEQTDDRAAVYLQSAFTVLETGRAGTGIDLGVFIDLDQLANNQLQQAFSFNLLVDPADATINQGFSLVVPGVIAVPDETNIDEGLIFLAGAAAVPTTLTSALLATTSVTQSAPGVLELRIVGDETEGVSGRMQLDDVNVGPSTAFLGTDGADSITASTVDTVIRGRGGDDAIDVSAGGVNTILFEPTLAENGTDTVTGFSLAANTALPDRIGIAGLDASELRGTGEGLEIVSAGDSIGANTGFVVFTTALMSDAEGMQALADLGLAADDIVYVLAGDGTNAELLRIVVDGGGNLPAANDLEVLAEFQGIGDLTGLSEDNILGFSPLPT